MICATNVALDCFCIGSKLLNVQALPDDLKTKLSIDDDLVSSPKEALSRASADRRMKHLSRYLLFLSTMLYCVVYNEWKLRWDWERKEQQCKLNKLKGQKEKRLLAILYSKLACHLVMIYRPI